MTCTPPVHVGETQGTWAMPQNSPSHHLKYYLQLKTKGDVGNGNQSGSYEEKLSKQGRGCDAGLSCHLPIAKSF